MADRLNWTVGHEGKGNVYDDGSISTWNVDHQGDPQHQQVSDQENEWQPAFLFYITADGGVNDGGIGFNNTTFKPDTTVLSEVCRKDPQLYDASDEEVELDEPNAQREHYHDDMGYGHAKNLMDMISKVGNMGAMHSEFKIPRHIRRKIRKWADRLKWPEDSEVHDARKYHITVLTFDEYCPDFVKFMSEEMKGREFYFKSSGFDIFKNMLVLRLESPAWERLAIRWGQLAADKELGPRRFPGGPKCHITIGEVPEGKWPQGVPDPNIEFTTKMFNVNINKTSDVLPPPDQPAQQPVEEASPSEPLDELEAWLKSVPGEGQSDILPVHYNSEDQISPEPRSNAAVGPHIDPPSHPFKPYDWAAEKTAADFNVPDDQPARFEPYMPVNWEQQQARIQQLYEQAKQRFMDEAYHTGPERALQAATEWLYDKAENLGEGGTMADDVSRRFYNEMMDTPRRDYMVDRERDDMMGDFEPTQTQGWDELQDIPGWVNKGYEPNLDAAPAEVYPEERAKQIEGVPPPFGREPTGIFKMPQGWERTPAEDQALIYQCMRDQIMAIRNGTRAPETAVQLFEGRLRGLNIPADRRDEAIQEFQQFAQQATQETQNQRAQQEEMQGGWSEVPNTIPPEWTASMRRITRMITGCLECGVDHLPDTDCPEDYANAKRNWYDRVWSEPGSPTEFPHQPRHWKHDHAPDVNQA